MTTSTSISPNYHVEDWTRLDLTMEADWAIAIRIFEDRIRGRFISIIDQISKERFAGFAVLALDCLLIETLQQFREGVAETPRGQSKTYFIRFLTQTSFRDCFDEQMAKLFYDVIRCGILHQGEVKESSLVLRLEAAPLVKLNADAKGLSINRKRFHSTLGEVFNNYLAELRDPANEELRRKFKWKMDHICRIVEATT